MALVRTQSSVIGGAASVNAKIWQASQANATMGESFYRFTLNLWHNSWSQSQFLRNKKSIDGSEVGSIQWCPDMFLNDAF